MKKTVVYFAIAFLAAMMIVSPAYAKKDGDPPGWTKGEKKGWEGESQPPGLFKKEGGKAERKAEKAAREAKKEAKKAERHAKEKRKEAEKAAKKSQREAREKEKQAKKEARKAREAAEKEVS